MRGAWGEFEEKAINNIFGVNFKSFVDEHSMWLRLRGKEPLLQETTEIWTFPCILDARFIICKLGRQKTP